MSQLKNQLSKFNYSLPWYKSRNLWKHKSQQAEGNNLKNEKLYEPVQRFPSLWVWNNPSSSHLSVWDAQKWVSESSPCLLPEISILAITYTPRNTQLIYMAGTYLLLDIDCCREKLWCLKSQHSCPDSFPRKHFFCSLSWNIIPGEIYKPKMAYPCQWVTEHSLGVNCHYLSWLNIQVNQRRCPLLRTQTQLFSLFFLGTMVYYSGTGNITRMAEVLFEKNHYREMGISLHILKYRRKTFNCINHQKY